MSVEERLRRAAAEIRARVERRAVPEPSPPAGQPRRGAVVALAALVVVALAATAVGLVAVTARDTTPAGRGSWVKVPFAATGFDPGSRVESVTRGGPGLVAVGFVVQPRIPLMTPGAWTSPDGRRWDAAPPEQFGAAELQHVVNTPDGLFVFGRPSGSPALTVWRSRDGKRWEPLTTEAPTGIRHVVAGGPGVVAAGFEFVGEPRAGVLRAAIWTSPDGRDWQPIAGDDRQFPFGYVAGLAHNHHGFVAVGSEQAPPGGTAAPLTGALVWTSPDGLHWRRIRDHAGLGHATAALGAPLAAQEDRFLLVAHIPPAAPSPTTTTSPPPAGVTSGTRGCAQPEPGIDAAFSSQDGTRWTQLTGKPPPIPGVSQAIRAHGQWLAAANEGTCAATRTVVYSSKNGRRWHRTIQDPRPTTPGPIRFPMALSATSNGAIAFVGDLDQIAHGRSGPDVWLWTAFATNQ